jgi:homoserine O-acetyltransferase
VGSRFPHISLRDLVEADVAALAAWASIRLRRRRRIHGGARALIVTHPDRVRAGLLREAGVRCSADVIGHATTQVALIKADPNWQGGDYYGTGRKPDAGLAIARQVAILSYLGELQRDTRFGNDSQADENPANGGRYAVQSYLEYQGDKLVERFDAGTYVALTDSMCGQDVGRGRGGVRKALRGCPVPVVVGGITSDRLYPLRLQEELAELLPGCTGLHVIESGCGHDGFLVEFEAVSDLIRKTLELAEKTKARDNGDPQAVAAL